MKRIVSILLLAIGLLTACRRGYTATDLLAKIMALPVARDAAIYFHGADPEGDGYLTREQGDLLYSGQDPILLSEDYVLALGKDDAVFEVHLYLALDGEKADAIELILQKRQSLLYRKENELYSPVPGDAEVWRYGKWVALIATEDNQSVKDLLKQAL